MRRVAITGYGIVSSLGDDRETVLTSLREGRSGIRFAEGYAEQNLRSHVAGRITIDVKEHVDRKHLRFMGPGAAYTHIAMDRALVHAGLNIEEISSPRIGVVAGSGGSSTTQVIETIDVAREKGVRRMGPFYVPRTMTSSISACLATAFKIRGVNYTISSACATSSHCIGHAADLIRADRQDMMFAGGGEEEHWTLAMQFDAMRALSSKYNDTPERASRAYDAGRDGFVISGGGGIVVLEEWDRAKARGANILAEVVGFGATSDGADMVAPSGEGATRCMQEAIATAGGPIGYINTHGTSTPAGDITELEAIGKVFGDSIPPISSTKSLSGHALGAAGVHEAIYCVLMLEEGFIAASANIENLDEQAKSYPIVRETMNAPGLRRVLSNSFGFGGTNGCLVLEKPK